MERTDTKDLVMSIKEFPALLPKLLALGEESGKALVFITLAIIKVTSGYKFQTAAYRTDVS